MWRWQRKQEPLQHIHLSVNTWTTGNTFSQSCVCFGVNCHTTVAAFRGNEETRLLSTYWQKQPASADTTNTDGLRQRWTSLIVHQKKRQFSGFLIVSREKRHFVCDGTESQLTCYCSGLVVKSGDENKFKKKKKKQLENWRRNPFCGPEPPFISWLFDLSTKVTPNLRFNLKTHPSLFLIPAKRRENLSKYRWFFLKKKSTP